MILHLLCLTIYFSRNRITSRGFLMNLLIFLSLLFWMDRSRLNRDTHKKIWWRWQECNEEVTDGTTSKAIIFVVGCSRVKITNLKEEKLPHERRREILLLHIFGTRISEWYLMPHYILISCTCDMLSLNFFFFFTHMKNHFQLMGHSLITFTRWSLKKCKKITNFFNPPMSCLICW